MYPIILVQGYNYTCGKLSIWTSMYFNMQFAMYNFEMLDFMSKMPSTRSIANQWKDKADQVH